MFCRCAFYLCLTIVISLSQTGICQESSPASPEQTEQQTEFDRLLAEWKELDSKLNESKAEYDAATEDVEKQDELRKDYQILVDDANVLVEELKAEAVSEFEKEPNNISVVQVLLGAMMNDASAGQDEDVLELGQQLIEGGINPRFFEIAAASEQAEIPVKEIFEELVIRQAEAKADDLPRVKLITSKGEIVLELFENESPGTVANFISLIKNDFYKDLKFHRVIEGSVAQGGCPKGDGSGGPGYKIYSECTNPESRRHFTGSLSMANSGRDTGGSQFFLTHRRTNELDGQHTVFGRIVSGMDVLRTLEVNYTLAGAIPGAGADVMESVEIIRDRGTEYVPNKVEKDTPEEEKSEEPKTQPDKAAGSGNTAEGGE